MMALSPPFKEDSLALPLCKPLSCQRRSVVADPANAGEMKSNRERWLFRVSLSPTGDARETATVALS